jgi:carboxymethylenebutenolidase
MTDIRARAIALYDDFTHGHGDRRSFMAQMIALAGSAAAAEALVAAIAPAEAAAQQVDPADKRIRTQKGSQTLASGRKMRGYLAAPVGLRRKTGAVMVVHENRGLNAHIEDVARRVAIGGYIAFAPDFLTSAGGTPADADQAREMIGKLDLAATVAEAVEVVKLLATVPGANGKVGAVGFCWGGAMTNRVAVAAGPALAAAASYYGPAPDPTEAAKVSATMLLHLAGNDARVNATGVPWGEALKAAGKGEAFVYPGVDHAFNNDTSAERYNPAAAKLAWDRTMAMFKARLT